MEQRSKIPGLALLALSFTQCTGREQAPDPIIGDWRAIQVDGEKHPKSETGYGEPILRGEQLRIRDDLAGELALYATQDYDGLEYNAERVAELVVDASEAPKYRIEVVHDLFENDEPYDEPVVPDTGYADTGYADSGAEDTDTGDTGALAGEDDDLAEVRPLKLPSAPELAPAEVVFDCTLERDTLTCDREGADELKHWVFTRIRAEDEV
ncbi:hypothetical protein [Nannocystis punicea]|uniref:Lipoprotein n=1 Tax=Nannocystis punicea TaxID=2995304 RepID=A0ABY7H6S7_9BACT|nr:hypothetical protein [Nannocystis poenicansa]WAS94729.1 hypothetical protein O0S08_01095 [Nannocystis poenicansa]